MKTEIRNNGIADVTVLLADEGKVLRRISDGLERGTELWLGYTHYINGELLEEPLLELPEHYEEIGEMVYEDGGEEG